MHTLKSPSWTPCHPVWPHFLLETALVGDVITTLLCLEQQTRSRAGQVIRAGPTIVVLGLRPEVSHLVSLLSICPEPGWLGVTRMLFLD